MSIFQIPDALCNQETLHLLKRAVAAIEPLLEALEPTYVYGEIYVAENATPVTLNSGAKVQVTAFDANGLSANTTTDHTEDHITVDVAGTYLCTVSVSFANDAAQTHEVTMGVWANNGVDEFPNVHADRTLSGGSGDIGSASLSGLITLAAGDTVELWSTTGDAADRDVIFEDVTLSIVKVAPA